MNKDNILDIVIKNLTEVVPELTGQKIQPSDSMADLGANSVDRSEILMLVLEELSLKVPLVEFAGAKNIGELVHVLEKKI
jgi:polyketide biosynthesis acyl carrier protein